MRQLAGKFVAFLLVCCTILSILGREVRAEDKILSELSTILESPCHDYGTSTKDGVFQISTDSHSLKAGDIVDVDIMVNYSNKEHGMISFVMENIYDSDSLEFMYLDISSEYREKYGASDQSREYDDWLDTDAVSVSDDMAKLVKKWAYIHALSQKKANLLQGKFATARYRVKKDTESLDLYYTNIEYLTEDYTSYRYFNFEGDDSDGYQYLEENGFGVLSLHLTDDSSPSSSVTLATAPAQGSEEISVPVNIEQNDGFNCLGLTIDYDTSLFTYENLEINDNLKSKISLDSVYEAPGSGKLKASFIALEDITDTGNFLTLKLKPKDGVSAGTTSNVGISVTQAANKAETKVTGKGTSCPVTITSSGGEGDHPSGGDEDTPSLGDVNADKSVDLIDAVYILQNYNQVREFTAVQSKTADVNADGEVNLTDALMIMKYFNGEIMSF